MNRPFEIPWTYMGNLGAERSWIISGSNVPRICPHRRADSSSCSVGGLGLPRAAKEKVAAAGSKRQSSDPNIQRTSFHSPRPVRFATFDLVKRHTLESLADEHATF